MATVVDATAPAYPGTRAIIDGSEAIASVETRISEAACAYPITPSTTMAAIYQAAVADGRTNLWGTPLQFIEPESEHSSASAAEGFALAGGRVTNFTAGQGLILMKEVLYVIAGKRLPAVFHVGARALTSQALNIHAGHDDIMGVADTGWGMLIARNAQEAADLTAIARRVAEETETPMFVVQDGFLTTHTLEDLRLPEDALLREFVGDPRARVRSYFDPGEALMTGVVQNQDSYMKGRDRPARLLRPTAGRPRGRDGRVDTPDRPRVGSDRGVSLRGRDRDRRRDGHPRRYRRRRGRSSAGPRPGRRQRRRSPRSGRSPRPPSARRSRARAPSVSSSGRTTPPRARTR